jgi:hypothetical protein
VEAIKYLSTADLEDNEPAREASNWGRYCPVTFIEEGALIESHLNSPVCYRGLIYFVANDNYAAKFVANPEKYLSRPPALPSLRICVLGGPFTGKTTQSRMLAKVYNLKFVSIDELLKSWDEEMDQRSLLKRNPLYVKVVKRCRSGKSIAPEMMIDLIQLILNEKNSADDKTISVCVSLAKEYCPLLILDFRMVGFWMAFPELLMRLRP